MIMFRALAVALCCALSGGVIPCRADEAGEHESLDRIRDLVKSGKLLPLSVLKPQVLKKWPGELIGVTVDNEDGAILYEFRVLRAAGQMTEVEVNAATGAVVEVENE